MHRPPPPSAGITALVGLFLAGVSGFAQGPKTEEIPEPFRSFIPEAQKRVAEFPEVKVGTIPGSHERVSVRLDEKPVVIGGKDRFGCVRLRTPKDAGLDMVWTFTVPKEWSQWYILPAEGTMDGFRNWLPADQLYEGFPASREEPTYLQTLSAKKLKPDTVYILWFKENTPTKGAVSVTAAINFLTAPTDGEWDHDAIEKGLGLKPAATVEQVKFLNSRGGRILLNPKYFKPAYAKMRTENVLTSIRSSKRFANGMFMEMRMEVPPCGTDPSFDAIKAEYGDPDIIITPAERKIFDESNSENRVVHYYDYFGFIIVEKGGKKHVYGVQTQASDMAQAAAQRDGLTWSDVPLPEMNLRIFYRDKKEIARLAYWGGAEAKLLTGDLPADTFRRDREELKHLGKGEWEYRVFNAQGKTQREGKLANHAFHGIVRDTFPDGKPALEVPYIHGKIDGR